MGITQLVLNEIRHRKLNFVLTLLSVTIAVGCLTGAQTLLRSDEVLTDDILKRKTDEVKTAVTRREEAVKAAGKALEDSVRKQMLGLGFNVLILPETQDLSELHLNGTLTETMLETNVTKLAESDIITINHLLPSVMKRISFKRGETQMDMIVQGTRGEVPIHHRGLKKMLLEAVPEDTIVIGHGIHQKLGLKKNDTFTLLGHDFTVTKLHPERGTIDDVTVWIHLKQAQKLLGMENVINAILALECECAGDRISQIRAEIAKLLPGTQVIEQYSKAITRAESRAKAKTMAEASLTAEQAAGKATLQRTVQTRVDIEDRHASLAGVLVPLVMLGCAMWIGFLAIGNVRQRRSEIGILRAIGLSSKQILILFLGRSLLTGLLGGLTGCTLGLLIGIQFGASGGTDISMSRLFAPAELEMLVLLALILAPLFSAIASWLPAVMAARQDPAVTLQE